MLDVVDLFREHDTRDELGVPFAGLLPQLAFPNVSVVTTKIDRILFV